MLAVNVSQWAMRQGSLVSAELGSCDSDNDSLGMIVIIIVIIIIVITVVIIVVIVVWSAHRKNRRTPLSSRHCSWSVRACVHACVSERASERAGQQLARRHAGDWVGGGGNYSLAGSQYPILAQFLHFSGSRSCTWARVGARHPCVRVCVHEHRYVARFRTRSSDAGAVCPVVAEGRELGARRRSSANRDAGRCHVRALPCLSAWLRTMRAHMCA